MLLTRIAVLLLFSSVTYGQALQQVLSCAGGNIFSKNFLIDFCVGETAVYFVTNAANVYPIGFLQPEISKPAKKDPVSNELKVYEFVSANNDEKNETLFVSGLESVPENKLIIFDKEGAIVFNKNNYDNTWNGDGLPADNYFYIFTSPNRNIELKGGLVLTR